MTKGRRSTYLGQYTDEVADTIAGELEKADISWSYKQAGTVTQALFAGEWGTRLFVDAERIADAREIAAKIERRMTRRREA
jgi:hypothetical protein